MNTFHSAGMAVSTETLAILRSAGLSKDDPDARESTQREDLFSLAPRCVSEHDIFSDTGSAAPLSRSEMVLRLMPSSRPAGKSLASLFERYPRHWTNARVSLSVAGRPSALDRFKSANAFSLEVISTHRLKRAVRASIRTSGVGCGAA